MKSVFFLLLLPAALIAGSAPRLSEAAPALDGRLDEPCWQQAAVYRGMKTLGVRTVPTADGELRLFTSGEYLYLGISAFEPEIAALRMATKPGDVKNYPRIHEDDDVVNLFFADGARWFCQIAFTPSGVMVFSGARPTTLLYEDWRQPRLKEAWNPAIEHAARVEKDRWVVEARLRLADFDGFRSNGWTFNFCRERRAGKGELVTLFPMTGSRFNDFTQYGRLLLNGITEAGEPVKAAKPVLAPAAPGEWSATGGTPGESGIRGGARLVSREALPVLTGQEYRLSGEFRSTGRETQNFYFGLLMLDAANREVLPQQVNLVPGSDTELTADTAAGEAEIRVKDASKWRKGGEYFVAFRTAPDYSDLPNTRLAYTAGVREVAREGEGWVIRLAGPHRFTGKAGTPVRLQYTGASYLYLDGKAQTAGKEWKPFEAVLPGFAAPGRPAHNRFWPGTPAVTQLLWLNDKSPEAGLEFRKVKLEAL